MTILLARVSWIKLDPPTPFRTRMVPNGLLGDFWKISLFLLPNIEVHAHYLRFADDRLAELSDIETFLVIHSHIPTPSRNWSPDNF